MHKYLLAAFAAALLLPSALLAEPALWLDNSDLSKQRYGQVSFRAQDGNELRAYTYRSTAFNPSLSPIWFVMHGTNRNADDYRDQAAAVAERKAALVVAIEFPEALYSSYTTNQVLFAEIEHVFDALAVVIVLVSFWNQKFP
jgi:poly(3-hydroxybutyrate) depolymerase